MTITMSKYNTIVLDDDSVITGKIIHSNAEYIYIIEEEDKLSQYSIEKIKTYSISKSRQEDSATSKDAPILELIEDKIEINKEIVTEDN